MKKALCFLIFNFCAFAFAQTSDDSSSASTSANTASQAPNSAVLSVQRKRNRRRKVQVKGNFRGTDPMIAPDGQSQLPPTDGSRPNGN
jgi:hypothetical protein